MGLQPQSGATQFSVRAVPLTSLQSCGSIYAYAWCNWVLMVYSHTYQNRDRYMDREVMGCMKLCESFYITRAP